MFALVLVGVSLPCRSTLNARMCSHYLNSVPVERAVEGDSFLISRFSLSDFSPQTTEGLRRVAYLRFITFLRENLPLQSQVSFIVMYFMFIKIK